MWGKFHFLLVFQGPHTFYSERIPGTAREITTQELQLNRPDTAQPATRVTELICSPKERENVVSISRYTGMNGE
jgi:hypothetical protein